MSSIDIIDADAAAAAAIQLIFFVSSSEQAFVCAVVNDWYGVIYMINPKIMARVLVAIDIWFWHHLARDKEMDETQSTMC